MSPLSTQQRSINKRGAVRLDAFGRRGRVQRKETHTAWVFLTRRFAYKARKPVRTRDVDLRRPLQRLRALRRELRQNRALAPGVYLGIVPVTRGPGATQRLGGSGPVVDWLLKMRRLPDVVSLEHRLVSGRAGAADAQRVARVMARFHQRCPVSGIAAGRHVERLVESIHDCGRALAAGGLDAPGTPGTSARMLGLLDTLADALRARVAAGRVVDGHGDLRPEHVFVLPRPLVIDRLDLPRERRELDAVDDVAYLALECERLGAPRLGRSILAAYRAASGDAIEPALVHLYQAHRALVRARLALEHAAEPLPRTAAHWRQRAALYLSLARAHTQACVEGIQSSSSATSEPPS